MKSVLLPGSFDPLTLGHVDIIERAAKIFDKVIVAISINSDKRGLFSFAQRKQIAEVSCAHIPNVTIVTVEGIIADVAVAMNVCAILKGIRNTTDFEWESTLSQINKFFASDIDTIFIPASPDKQFISSSFVRELIKYEKPLNNVLSPEAIALIQNNFGEEQQ